MYSTAAQRGRRGPETALARYYASLENATVLTAAQERALAREFVAREIAAWRTLLDAPQAIVAIRSALEAGVGEHPELRVPGEVRTLARLARSGRVAASDKAAWNRALGRAAHKLRALDGDRVLAQAARNYVQTLAEAEPSSRARQRHASRVEEAFAAQAAVKNRFIQSNLRLVASMARRYGRTSGMPLEDVIQEGNLGLVKAVERFDPERGFRFSTYAAWWIRHMITRGIEDKARVVRIPVHTQQRMRRVGKAREAFAARHGRLPSARELANEVGLSEAQVEEYGGTRLTDHTSLDERLGDDSRTSRLEQLSDERIEAAEDHLTERSLRGYVEQCLEDLSPMQADILRCRFGLDGQDEQTLREIGDRYGLSRERIRQLQEQALQVCRDKLRAEAPSEQLPEIHQALR